MKEINRMIQVLLNMAEYADTEDVEDINEFFMNSARMGCLAFSRGIRQGVVKLVEFINDYYSLKERNKYLESSLQDYSDFFQNVLGCSTIDYAFFNEDEKERIGSLVKEIREEALDEDSD